MRRRYGVGIATVALFAAALVICAASCREPSGRDAAPPSGVKPTATGSPAASEEKPTLTASVEVAQRERVILFSFKLTNAAGKAVPIPTLPNGQRPDPPKVDVYNSLGDKVYSCTLQYG